MLSLLAMLTTAALADDPGDVQLLHQVSRTDAPTQQQAIELVQKLLSRVRNDNVDAKWIAQVLHAPTLPDAPRDAWIASWTYKLQPTRPIGAALRATEGISLVVQGPAYQRVLLQGPADLHVVVVLDAEGQLHIERIERSTCSLCDERSRFVRDLLHDVATNGDQSHRLTPHIELDVTAHMRQRGLFGDWVGVLQQRNRTGAVLTSLLRDARVTGGDGDIVQVTYANGLVDTWSVHWKDGRWQVAYDGLSEDSPLRMSRNQSEQWRERSTQRASAQRAWRPAWRAVGRGAGLLIADRAIDAMIDPRDGTVLVVVMDMDRVLAGIYRIDPDTQQVLERIHLPAPDPRTQFPSDGWFSAWRAALSPDAHTMAVTGPNRVWSIDLQTGHASTVTRGAVSWLSWTSLPPSGSPYLVVGKLDGLWLFDQGPVARLRVPGEPMAGWATPTGGVCLTRDGALWNVDTESLSARLCCGEIASAAWSVSGGTMVASCAAPCDTAAVLMQEGSAPRNIAGAGVQHAGASVSPDGRWFTTGSSSDTASLLLWEASGARPVASVPVGPVQRVRWARGGTVLLTVGLDGHVHWWDVDMLRQRYGLR
ncbi:MAG: hypothetical protein ACI9MC_000929 [Kiritimatiellia bacterium]|jgi:hypothetical protein